MSDSFKDDYPDMYQKFLEMNRALAMIQKATGSNRDAVRRRGLPDERPDAEDMPNMLEWD